MQKILNLAIKHKAYLIVFGFTLLSHAMGFGREVLIAYKFGASSISDGILVGIAPVTLFLGMVGVGYSNAAMARIKSPDNHQVIEHSLHPILVVGVLAAVFFYSFNEAIIGFTAPGVTGEGYILAVELVKLSAIGAGVLGVYYWFKGIRHLEGRFLRVSISELMPNIGIFIGILLLYNVYGVVGIAFGITLGYLLQLVWVFDYKRVNLKGFGKTSLWSADNRLIYKNTFYGALGMSGIVVELFVDRYFASTLGEGNVASINFAYKVMTLPLYTAVFAIVTVMFPRMIAMRDDRAAFNKAKSQINWMLIGFCAVNTLVFVYFSHQIISLLFGYGLFDEQDVSNTAPLLGIYSIGLVAHAMVMFHCKARYALEDFRIPLIAGAVAALVNLVLDFLLVDSFGAEGLAWATTIAATVNAAIVMFVKPPSSTVKKEQTVTNVT